MSGTVLFAMHQEVGHLNPTFHLSRTLKTLGHDVRYFAIPDLAGFVDAQGFTTAPWFPELYPKGWSSGEGERGLLARRRAATRNLRAIADQLLQGRGAAAELLRVRPDVVVFDVNEPLVGFLARKLGITSVAINTSLPQTMDPCVPPLRSDAPYKPTLRGAIRSGLLWRSFLWRRRVAASLASLGGMCPPYDLIRRLAPRFGVPDRLLDCRTAYLPQLREVPELVLCPEEFDFPRPASRLRTYVESLDTHRQEVAFPWEALRSDRPLVYCALGTQRYRPTAVERFIGHLLAAMTMRPEVQLVLALGRHDGPTALSAAASNVIVVEKAPQLALLPKASAMITHGGLGSIKECIAFRVPMLVLPLAMDQPGNGARVTHHGLGITEDIHKMSPATILATLDRLLEDRTYVERLGRMQSALEQTERAAPGAALLDELIERQTGNVVAS